MGGWVDEWMGRKEEKVGRREEGEGRRGGVFSVKF